MTVQKVNSKWREVIANGSTGQYRCYIMPSSNSDFTPFGHLTFLPSTLKSTVC